MAKLGDIRAYAQKPGGISYSGIYPCTVLGSGLFWVTIPDVELESFRALLDGRLDVELKRAKKGETCLVTTTLKAAQAVCQAHAQWKIEGTVEEELRIYYSLTQDLAFWKTGNGAVEPDGMGQTTGTWVGKRPTHSKGEFRFGLAAHVHKRVVTTPRVGKPAVTFCGPGPEDLGPEGTRLNRFQVYFTPQEEARFSGATQWVPYSEAAARFFADQLACICQQSEDLKNLLDRPSDEVAAALAAGLGSLLR